MGMRVSVFLVCVGALLAVGTDVSVSGVDLTVVGITVVGAGAIGLLMTLLVWDPRPQVAGVERAYAELELPGSRRRVDLLGGLTLPPPPSAVDLEWEPGEPLEEVEDRDRDQDDGGRGSDDR
jgi:hypothetical protein